MLTVPLLRLGNIMVEGILQLYKNKTGLRVSLVQTFLYIEVSTSIYI